MTIPYENNPHRLCRPGTKAVDLIGIAIPKPVTVKYIIENRLFQTKERKSIPKSVMIEVPSAAIGDFSIEM
jgi:hypothetical protein